MTGYSVIARNARNNLSLELFPKLTEILKLLIILLLGSIMQEAVSGKHEMPVRIPSKNLGWLFHIFSIFDIIIP